MSKKKETANQMDLGLDAQDQQARDILLAADPAKKAEKAEGSDYHRASRQTGRPDTSGSAQSFLLCSGEKQYVET